jgi:hypothetical protein
MYVFQAMGGGGTRSVRVHIAQFFPKTFAQGRFAQQTVSPHHPDWTTDHCNEIVSSLKGEEYMMAR